MIRFLGLEPRAIKASAMALTILAASASWTVAGDGDDGGGYRPGSTYGGDYRSGYNGNGYGLFGLGLGAGLGNFGRGVGGYGSGVGYGYGGYGNGYGSGYGYGTPAGFGTNGNRQPVGRSSPTVLNQTSSAPYLTTGTYEPGDGYRYPVYYNPATGQYGYYPVVR
jgi:hypothetical protein